MCILVTLALARQGDHAFTITKGYIARPCLEITTSMFEEFGFFIFFSLTLMGLHDGSVDKVLVTSPNDWGLIPKTYMGIAEEGHQAHSC